MAIEVANAQTSEYESRVSEASPQMGLIKKWSSERSHGSLLNEVDFIKVEISNK
jgi:hypothetical protein